MIRRAVSLGCGIGVVGSLIAKVWSHGDAVGRWGGTATVFFIAGFLSLWLLDDE